MVNRSNGGDRSPTYTIKSIAYHFSFKTAHTTALLND